MFNQKKNMPPIWTKFAISGLSGFSGWLFIHPFDVLKVRMQINEGSNISSLKTLNNIFKKEGIKGLYSGLSAAAARQFSYTTSRLGLYDVFVSKLNVRKNNLNYKNSSNHLSLIEKLFCGLSAGSISATLCCPIEVALVRMQADGMVSKELQRGYKNVFDAIYKVATNEGITTLWRGVVPTVTRGAVVSMTQLATYDQAKEMLLDYKIINENGTLLHLSSAVCSGFIYCLASLPLDITKTRMQNQLPLPDGSLKYTSVGNALLKIPRNEGLFALWKGFPAYFARGGGHTIFMFLFVEKYRSFVNHLYK
jgi:solute carrier family 25 (mitochondrial oxoglutarate transporter), member 11